VTLGFFDDILIPPEGLQYPSRFDEREQIWIWEYSNEGEESHEMYMDKVSSTLSIKHGFLLSDYILIGGGD